MYFSEGDGTVRRADCVDTSLHVIDDIDPREAKVQRHQDELQVGDRVAAYNPRVSGVRKARIQAFRANGDVLVVTFGPGAEDVTTVSRQSVLPLYRRPSEGKTWVGINR